MDARINELLNRAEESGVDAKDLISALLKRDKAGIMELIGREVEHGRNQGLSADYVFNRLSDLFGEEQIATYLEVQSLVDSMMSTDGLEIDMGFYFDGLDFLKTNRELIRYELKRRGVSAVSYVGNSMSGIFTIQAKSDYVEMSAWMTCIVPSCRKLREISLIRWKSFCVTSWERIMTAWTSGKKLIRLSHVKILGTP